MENDSEYYVKNPKQIFSHLNLLLKHNCLISAHFGDKNESFITTIIGLDLKKNLIKLDYGPKEYLNKQLLNASKTEFRAEFEGIKVAFSGQKIKKVRSDGQIVFSMPLPSSIYWMQRRKYYRIKIPLSHDSYCKIALVNPEDESTQTLRFKLLDISISGLAFKNDQMEISKELIPTTSFENCRLYLDGADFGNISLQIKNKFNLIQEKPEKGQRIGCLFTNISSAGESVIQRYMQEIEREHRNIS